MTPIDPAKPASSSPKPPAAPPWVNEDPNLAMVRRGLDLAEDEARDEVAGAYEESARASDDPAESLDDIDFSEAEDESTPAELSALHGEGGVSGEEEE